MIDLNLTKLSVLHRAAVAYATDNVAEIARKAEELYPSGAYPFALSDGYPLPLHLFSPRLSAMLSRNDTDAGAIWKLITARENIIRMLAATEIERTAAESLGRQLEESYPPQSDPSMIKRKQMIGYMIKVVMECFGHMVFTGRMQVSTTRGDQIENRRSNYFTTASRYAPLSDRDARELSKQIEDPAIKESFKAITKLVLSGKTAYHRQYDVYGLTYWDTLLQRRQS